MTSKSSGHTEFLEMAMQDLQAQPGLADSSVWLTLHCYSVHFGGKVATYYQKHSKQAEQLVSALPSIHTVISGLGLEPQAKEWSYAVPNPI